MCSLSHCRHVNGIREEETESYGLDGVFRSKLGQRVSESLANQVSESSIAVMVDRKEIVQLTNQYNASFEIRTRVEEKIYDTYIN